MNVQELIDRLSQVEDKSIPVRIGIESGRGCYSMCNDPYGSVDEDDEEQEFFIISGEETDFMG